MTTFRTLVPAFAVALLGLGAATNPPSAEAFWFGNYEKGSALEARRACRTWAGSQGQLTIRPELPGLSSWPRDVGNQAKWDRNGSGTAKVPVAYCLEEPETRNVLGLKFQVPNKYINNSANELEGVGNAKVVRRYRY